MGVDINTARILLQESQSNGWKAGKVNMLGRQKIFLSETELQQLQSTISAHYPALPNALPKPGAYAEQFLQTLGASEVHATDASDFEQASIIHDLNKPIPERLYRQYDTVIDGGTLEHVFNYPEALRSAMNMVAPGGHLLLFTPANNLFGHGFYQFSPDLFYAIFQPQNGFVLQTMLMYEFGSYSKMYAIANPAQFNNRITMRNSRPVYFYVKAQRIADTNIDVLKAMQSDYEQVRWQGQSWAHVGEQQKSLIRNVLDGLGIRKSLYRLKTNKAIHENVYGNMLPDFWEEVAIP